jgi:RNA polymerase sigma factor (sigma-70 family)
MGWKGTTMPSHKPRETDHELLECAEHAAKRMIAKLHLRRPYKEILSTAVHGALIGLTDYVVAKGDLRTWLRLCACNAIRTETRGARRYARRNVGSVVEGGVQMHAGSAAPLGADDGEEGEGVVPIALEHGEANGSFCGGSVDLARGPEELLSGRGDPRGGAALVDALDALTEDQRHLITRRFQDEAPMKELEEEEGISDGTLRTRLAEAAGAIREQFLRQGVTERPSCLADPTDMLFPSPALVPDVPWEAPRRPRRRRATRKL